MFAVIKTGGKQYKVAKHDVVTVEKLPAEVGESVTLDDVRLIGGDGAPTVGQPNLANAQVSAEVLDQGKGRTIKIFKKKRRKNHRRCNGHRQRHTVLKITDIQLDGQSLSAPEDAEARAAKAAQKAQARQTKQATNAAIVQSTRLKGQTVGKRRLTPAIRRDRDQAGEANEE